MHVHRHFFYIKYSYNNWFCLTFCKNRSINTSLVLSTLSGKHILTRMSEEKKL